ncbi:MAG: hypothetical protein QXY16_02105 [Nanopusillaceae archaeon]
MNENKAKFLYIFILIIVFLVSIYILFRNPVKSVVCLQNNDTIICRNLALIDRQCIIFLKNHTVEKHIKGLSEIKIENEILIGWRCQ